MAESPTKMSRAFKGARSGIGVDVGGKTNGDTDQRGADGSPKVGTPCKGLLKPKGQKSDASRRIQWCETIFPERTGLMTPRSGASRIPNSGPSSSFQVSHPPSMHLGHVPMDAETLHELPAAPEILPCKPSFLGKWGFTKR